MKQIISTTSLLCALLLLCSGAVSAQQSVNSSGGDSESSTGRAFISFGQTVYLTHSGASGSASEGVQQVDCPRLTASDTATCHETTVLQMTADQDGGTWSVRSGIGSTIDTAGLMTAGTITGFDDAIDTVVYSLNGCEVEHLVRVYGPPKVNAINGGPYCNGDLGHLYETGGQAVSWSWVFPAGFASSRKNPAVSPVVPGAYTVEVTDKYGCTSRDTTTVCVSQVGASCESVVELALGPDGTASFDPSSLLTGFAQQPCVSAGVAPQGMATFTCADIGGQGTSFVVADSLGCEETCTTTIVVKDTSRPVEACEAIQDLVLVWEGTEVIPASLADGSDDNCGAGNLEFSFFSDFKKSSLTLNCREKLLGPFDVDVFMRDESGNVSMCTVTVGYVLGPEECDCDAEALVLDGAITPFDYRVKQTITSAGMVAASDTVLFKAEQSITLRPGFVAVAGSFFGARIDSCTTDPPPVSDSRDASESTLNATEVTSTVYPNPFRGVFRLEVDLPEASTMSVQLHHLGSTRLIGLLDEATRQAGHHELSIDGSRLAPGVYVLTVQACGQQQTHKVVKVQ